MSKLIIKTALKTALIAIASLAVAFAVLCFGFPQHMAAFSEKSGNYPAATWFASLRYNYTGDGYDLARCLEDAMLASDSRGVVEFGDKLIVHKQFADVCTDRSAMLNTDYKQYVCGKLAVAKYILGDFDAALDTAQTANGTSSFSNGNALMTLCVRVIGEKDAAHADALVTALGKVTPAVKEEIELKNSVCVAVLQLNG